MLLGKNLLLVAPSGTGKPATALRAALPVAIEHDLKIIYLCGTHSQSTRVIKEFQKISAHFSPKINGMYLGSRIQ